MHMKLFTTLPGRHVVSNHEFQYLSILLSWVDIRKEEAGAGAGVLMVLHNLR